jgi:hypothetical protein
MGRFENILTSSVAGMRMFAATGAGGLFLAVVPGLAAALGAKSVPAPVAAGDAPAEQLKTRINDSDMAHMNAFPADRKTWVLEQIMALAPLQKSVHMDNHHYEKLLLKLRGDGYALIDLQPQETAFTSVWYRNGRIPGAASENVAMLLWETLEVGDSTTVMMWRI